MSTILRVTLTILLAMGTPALLSCQATYTAQLTGTVTDSSGGVLAGAKVILTDEATNIAATADTDEQGVYVFTGLRPGSYMLRVETYNFASVERKNLVLAVNQRASLNVTLNPGSNPTASRDGTVTAWIRLSSRWRVYSRTLSNSGQAFQRARNA
jgi:hypothetical protein